MALTGNERGTKSYGVRETVMTDETDAESVYRLTLPWARPPLTENLRLHWRIKAQFTADIRTTVAWLARAARIPPSTHCSVRLIWAPGDFRRRDHDNLSPTYKAACDGIVDALVVRDDVPALMTKHMPEIVPPPSPVGMWLEVTVFNTADDRNSRPIVGSESNN
jgi:crossover junction endodeoxyribonuclease RusA